MFIIFLLKLTEIEVYKDKIRGNLKTHILSLFQNKAMIFHDGSFFS